MIRRAPTKKAWWACADKWGWRTADAAAPGQRELLQQQDDSEDAYTRSLPLLDKHEITDIFRFVIRDGHLAAEVELTADNPGLTLFHCHQQDHMDMGFMMLFRYA